MNKKQGNMDSVLTKDPNVKQHPSGYYYREMVIPDFSAIEDVEEIKTPEDIPNKTIRIFDTDIPKRLDSSDIEETHQEYRIRRSYQKERLKTKLKGHIAHHSRKAVTIPNTKFRHLKSNTYKVPDSKAYYTLEKTSDEGYYFKSSEYEFLPDFLIKKHRAGTVEEAYKELQYKFKRFINKNMIQITE